MFKKLIAVSCGNALEFYDFLIFSFFSIQIAHDFFPEKNGLVYTLAVFGTGFLARPLGAAAIGTYGDRRGRKPAMLISLSLMGIATLSLAALPSYQSLGWISPVGLLVCRLVQGFAVGGEVGPSTAWLLEAAPSRRRSLFISLQYTSQQASILLAGLVGLMLIHVLDHRTFEQYGWRIALSFGLMIFPFGLFMRKKLPEEMPVIAGKDRQRLSINLIGVSFALISASTISTYVVNYLATFVQDTLRSSTVVAFDIVALNGALGCISAPIAGLLSDRFGRSNMVVTMLAIMATMAVPLFIGIASVSYPPTLILMAALLNCVVCAMSVAGHAFIAEKLPQEVRSGAFGLLYAATVSIVGGSTQFVVKLLIQWTDITIMPGIYMMGSAIVAAALFFCINVGPCKSS